MGERRHWTDGFINPAIKSIDLSKVILAVYLHNYQKYFKTCLTSDAVTFRLSVSDGFPVDFKINKKFSSAFQKVGLMSPESPISSLSDFLLNGGGRDLKQEVVAGTKQMMIKYNCNSPEIMKMEQALLKVGLR